jgi:hypothetical protein
MFEWLLGSISCQWCRRKNISQKRKFTFLSLVFEREKIHLLTSIQSWETFWKVSVQQI